MNILGISCYYHDAAAAIVCNGTIVAAAQEERFTRVKHDAQFPHHAVRYCLAQAGCRMDQIDAVCFYDKPFLKFERILETAMMEAPKGLRAALKAIPIWIKQKIWIDDAIRSALEYEGRILYPEHHHSHAASAFYPSPFKEAAVLTVDGVGEWSTTSISHGKEHHLKMLKELHFPHSLGLLYSAFTYHAGFKVNSGEYKLMGLAPYGKPRFVDRLYEHVLDVKADGSFRMHPAFFEYTAGLKMTSARFSAMFEGPPRPPEAPLTQREMDLAASIQVVTEEILFRMVDEAKRITGSRNLCLAGGVALNCVANGKLLKQAKVDQLWIQPAAGDAGGALGAALVGWHSYYGKHRQPSPTDSMQGAFLGPSITTAEITPWLDRHAVVYEALSHEQCHHRMAEALDQGNILGWFHGRMEFGPRALGHRSILADPRNPEMQRKLNLSIKKRESFRPFAPMVMSEYAAAYFDLAVESPYMLVTAEVVNHRQKKQDINAEGLDLLYQLRSDLPAVTHVDYSARVQTVDRERNPQTWALLEAFRQRTGTPVLINTSFNVRGEPPVASIEDAWTCFASTAMDILVLENVLIRKADQTPEVLAQYKPKTFAKD
jgi:carbamoyltransferase